MRLIYRTLLGIAALLSFLAPVHALPLFASSHFFRAASLAAIVRYHAVVPRVVSPSKPLWSLGSPGLWGAATDPSLRLTDWNHVFNIAALGGFDVPLRSDPGERANILLAANAVDNTTLAPGETFSFNDTVGERTPDRGYQDGLMFDNGAIVRGTGGGICLVATGLYNAALSAGLEIDERHPHSGLVSYAPPGCDAGIAFGSEDLKFRNDTAEPLVIRAVASEDTVQIRIFGKAPPPSQQVVVKSNVTRTLPAPVETKPDPALLPGQAVVDQKPRAGYDVTVERYWLRHWRVVRHEVVTQETRAPRPEILRVAVAPAPETQDTLDTYLMDNTQGEQSVGLKSSAVGRGRPVSAFADTVTDEQSPFLSPRRGRLGASPHSGGIYSHGLLPLHNTSSLTDNTPDE